MSSRKSSMLAAQKQRPENLVKAGLLTQEQLQSYLHDFTVNKILKLEISHLSHGLIRNRH